MFHDILEFIAQTSLIVVDPIIFALSGLVFLAGAVGCSFNKGLFSKLGGAVGSVIGFAFLGLGNVCYVLSEVKANADVGNTIVERRFYDLVETSYMEAQNYVRSHGQTYWISENERLDLALVAASINDDTVKNKVLAAARNKATTEREKSEIIDLIVALPPGYLANGDAVISALLANGK